MTLSRNIGRRDFLKISGAALGGLAIAGSTYLYLNNESHKLVIERIPIPLTNLDPALEGFRVVQISDIHLYPLTKSDLVKRAVEIANKLNPDLTVLTGDYVWRDVEAMFELAPILAGLNARYGVFACLGNHDIWTDVEVVLAGLKEAGLPVLINEGLAIPVGKGELFLAGLDDAWSGAPSLKTALQGAPPGAPVVLLAHEPDPADRYSQDERVSLHLAGHSHGGQIRFPMIGPVVCPSRFGVRFASGLFHIEPTVMPVSRGISGVHTLRFNCPPEISLLELRCRERSG